MQNMKLLKSYTVGAGGIGQVDFTSIPQTYTDLIIKVSSNVNSLNVLRVRFNGVSTNDYTQKVLRGSGAGMNAYSNAGWDSLAYFSPSYNNDGANIFSNIEYYIPNYTGSSIKPLLGNSVTEANGSTAYQVVYAGLLNNTSAITSISLEAQSGLFNQYSTFWLYGVANTIASGAKAYGGVVTEDENYWYHTFFSSGVFTPTQSLTCDFLVIAGGGGGGAGGSGAGGLRSSVGATGGGGSLESALSLSATSYAVTVGAGGAGGGGGSFNGTQGSDTTFSSITSSGGGYGGLYTNGNGGGGGSGGGAGTRSNNVNGVGGSGVANQGYGGGANRDNATYESGGGGGGGAGGAGANAPNTGIGYDGGNGGVGVAITALSVPTVTGVGGYYAGGGGGGSRGGNTGPAGVGGLGGGGDGRGSNGMNQAGARGTGGGAGGTQYNNGGLSGGSGLVILRYAK